MTPIQWASFTLAIGTLFLAIETYKHHKEEFCLQFPIFFLTSHTIVFYFFVLANDTFLNHAVGQNLIIWSSILRFHALVTFFTILLNGILKDRREKRNGQ